MKKIIVCITALAILVSGGIAASIEHATINGVDVTAESYINNAKSSAYGKTDVDSSNAYRKVSSDFYKLNKNTDQISIINKQSEFVSGAPTTFQARVDYSTTYSYEEIYKVVSSHWCNSGNQSWSTNTSIIK